MLDHKAKANGESLATCIDPQRPNYVGSDADLMAALAVGDADIEAGRTESFDAVAAELRRNYAKA